MDGHDFTNKIYQSDWTALRELYLSEPDTKAVLFADDNERLGALGLTHSEKSATGQSIVTTLTDAGREAMKVAYERFGFAGPPNLPLRISPNHKPAGRA